METYTKAELLNQKNNTSNRKPKYQLKYKLKFEAMEGVFAEQYFDHLYLNREPRVRNMEKIIESQ